MSQILNYPIPGGIPSRNWERRAFMAAYAGKRWRLWWLRLRGKNGRLLDLNRLKKGMNIAAIHSLGIQSVPIIRIVGSEGRSHAFTIDFRPMQTHTMQRWMDVANANAHDVSLPPVELILIDSSYFVRDGHHRVSVARHFGQTHIDAMVTHWLLNTADYSAANKPEIDWQLLQRLQMP